MKAVVITTGDPAGCGPVITLEAVAAVRKLPVDFFVIGDKKILETIPAYSTVKKRITLIDAATSGIERLKKGFPSKLSGYASLSYLDKAFTLMQKSSIVRLATAPVSKEAVQMVEPGFTGHTEYLAHRYRVKNVAMMMASSSLKVILFTRHCPLRDVSSHITEKALLSTFSLAYQSLVKMFKIKNPKIAVTSVNPHAGINTFLDKEEKSILAAIKKSPKALHGPYPADTIFTKDRLSGYDCIICCYHDQGMIPFKLLSFKNGVNVTLGLPIIRTSPDHGVAYDIIQKGKKPFSTSMAQAIRRAVTLSL